MKKNHKQNHNSTIIAAVASLGIVVLFYFMYGTLHNIDPNVVLNFQHTSDDYYKIVINDAIIIDSEQIKNLKYSNEHDKTKTLNLKLDTGDYKIQIKDSIERVISESQLTN
jgi:hypothetical protein